MPIIIDDSILEAAHLDEMGFRLEIAIALFAQDRFTMAQAAKFASIPHMDFQAMLSDRQICVHYNVTDFQQDVETLRQLGRI